MASYVIGVDFGSLSGRAVLVDSQNGTVAAQRTMDYPHGIMPGIGPGWALHDPADYLAVLEGTLPPLLEDAGVSPEQGAAIGWDVTACTMLPALADGTPLCRLPGLEEAPHADVKPAAHAVCQQTGETVGHHIADLAQKSDEPPGPALQLFCDVGAHQNVQTVIGKG